VGGAAAKTTFKSVLVVRAAEGAHDLRPSFIPLIIADNIAQRQHRINIGPSPVHTAAFQARLNHQFVGAFSGAIANRPACRQEGGVLHLSLSLLQIGLMRRHLRRLGFGCYHLCHLSQHSIGAFVFERVQLCPQPRLCRIASLPQNHLTHGGDMLPSMGKVQDTYSIGPVVIAKLLRPLRPIRHKAHCRRRLHPATVCFHQGQALEALRISQARKIAVGTSPIGGW